MVPFYKFINFNSPIIIIDVSFSIKQLLFPFFAALL